MTAERVAYFAPDATQGCVTKRIAGFRDAGFEVTSFTFRRDRATDLGPVCENVDLGVVPDRRYLYRAFRTVWMLGRLWQSRGVLKASRVYYARMLDCALIAMLASRVFNPRARIFYEVADIRRILMSQGWDGRFARWLERRVLASCERVVVTSPAFTSRYLEPLQSYDGLSFLLENKIYADALPAVAAERRRNLAEVREGGDPIRIAWFGHLDCPETWRAIKETAARFPDRVAFYLRGYPIADEAEIRAASLAFPNIEFGGSFNNRRDLGSMYRQVDLVLGLDLTSREGNTWWLLPNSLYEAGAFGRPLITSAGTETADRVRKQGLGWVLEEPIAPSLAAFVEGFSWEEHARVVRQIATIEVEEFAGQAQLYELAEIMRSAMSWDAPDDPARRRPGARLSMLPG